MIPKKNNAMLVKAVVALYAVVLLTLILLAASNYPVQWKQEVNRERYRALEVFAQAIEYYTLDHSGKIFDLPQSPSMISNQSNCSFACPALGKDIPCYNLSETLVPNYMHEILRDPLSNSKVSSNYYLSYDQGVLALGSCEYFFAESVTFRKKL